MTDYRDVALYALFFITGYLLGVVSALVYHQLLTKITSATIKVVYPGVLALLIGVGLIYASLGLIEFYNWIKRKRRGDSVGRLD